MGTKNEAVGGIIPRESMKVPIASIVNGKNIRRREITPENDPKLLELAESIKSVGVLEPLILMPFDGKNKTVDQYSLVAGFRRLAAAKIAGGESTVSAIVYRGLTDRDALEIQISENIHRADLAPTEEAAVYEQMADKLGYTREEIALRVGKSEKHIGRYLRLLKLPEGVRARIDEGEISLAKAQFFCSLPQVVIDDMLKDGVDGWPARFLKPSYSLKEAKDKILADYIKKLGKNLIRFDKGKAYKGTGYNKKEEWPACTVCPYKGQMELFEEHDGGDDVCPFRPCLSAKNTIVKEAQEAAAKRAAKKAEKTGGGGSEAKSVVIKKQEWEIRSEAKHARSVAAIKHYAAIYFGDEDISADRKEITPNDFFFIVGDILDDQLGTLHDDDLVGHELCQKYIGKDLKELKKSGSIRELLFAAVLAIIVEQGEWAHECYKKWPGYTEITKDELNKVEQEALARIKEEEKAK